MSRVRLDKYLADMGLGTRSEVKKLLKKGLVTVNGEKAVKPEQKIETEADCVLADGRPVSYAVMEYYMLNKPEGVVSATEDAKEKTVLDCITDKKRKDLFPVGRLDKDTVGLLLITNDGELAHRLLSPRKHVDKTYRVELAEPLYETDKRKLEEGLSIGDEKPTRPAVITEYTPGCKSCLITIQEGRYHQVKRMFAAVNNQVTGLQRLSMGSLFLDESLRPGEYRKLTEEEIERLRENA